jgi:hypothetical protein
MKPPTLILTCLLFALVACGGGGSTGGTTPPPGPTTITVAGKVLKWTGKPVADIPVFITDATGSKPQVLSGSDGSFSVANVQKPYSISAVPATGSGLWPYTVDRVSITNPQVVLNSGLQPNFGTECSPVPSDTNLNLTFPPVGAGNTASIYFLAKGISYRPSQSSATISALPGMTSRTIPLTFDKNICLKELSGKAVYLEKDASGTIIKKGTKDVTLLPGNPAVGGSTESISTGNVVDVSFKGTLQLPQGATTAELGLFMKIGNGLDSVYASIASSNITAASPNFELKTVDLAADGIGFRLLATATIGSSVSWVWSDVLTGNNSSINLAVPGFSATIAPNGDTPGGNVNPTFSYNPVNGMNFYDTVFIAGGGGNDIWLGGTTQTSIKLPALSAPAQIALNKAYTWYPITAINLRDANLENASDKILDGRTIKHSLVNTDALSEPDLIAAGSLNLAGNAFKILP